jgi:ferredoxin--NADP+ reductase
VAGWSREASSGLVGVARKDGENGALAVTEYLQTLSPAENPEETLKNIRKRINHLDQRVIVKEDLQYLEMAEKAEAEKLQVEDFKFKSDSEMLRAIERLKI